MDFSLYNLARDPFAATSEPEVSFLSQSQQEALQAIIYGIEGRQGFVTILGESGLGKTTLLRSYLERIDQKDRLRIIYLSCFALSFTDILKGICQDLDITFKADNVYDTIEGISNALIDQYIQGKNLVVVLDNVHNASVHTLGSLLLLADIEIENKKLLQLVLVGQPEFERKLQQPELRQLKGCLNRCLFISPFTRQESADYVQHRLARASMQEESLFTRGALKQIVRYAQGNPSILGQLCSEALVAGVCHYQKPISVKIVKEVIVDFDRDGPTSVGWWKVAGLVAALLVLGLLLNFLVGRWETPSIAARHASSDPTAHNSVTSETREPSALAESGIAIPEADVPSTPVAQDTTVPQGDTLSPLATPDAAVPDGVASSLSSDRSAVLPQAHVPSVAPMPNDLAPETDVSLAEKTPKREIEPAVDNEDQGGHGLAGEVALTDTHVICVTPRPTGDRGRDIVLMDYAGDGTTKLIADGALNLAPVLSPDGAILAYTSYREGSPTIYLRHLSTATEERLTLRSGLALPGSWSSDGRHLTLSKSIDGNSDIFLYDMTRKHLRRLTTHKGIDILPSFAPDNTRLVFTSKRDGSSQIYLTDVYGSSPRRLTTVGAYNTSAVWSPRDDTIAFVGRSPQQTLEIYTIRADGTHLQRLAHGGIANETPTWAPDGRFLMYTSVRGNVQERHLVRADGQGHRILPGQGAMCRSPQWVTRLIR